MKDVIFLVVFQLKKKKTSGYDGCREIKTNSWRKITHGCLFQERYNGHIQACGH